MLMYWRYCAGQSDCQKAITGMASISFLRFSLRCEVSRRSNTESNILTEKLLRVQEKLPQKSRAAGKRGGQTLPWQLYAPLTQPASSLWSRQSWTLLHCLVPWMQDPSPHWNSSGRHVNRAGRGTHTWTHMWNWTCKSPLIPSRGTQHPGVRNKSKTFSRIGLYRHLTSLHFILWK